VTATCAALSREQDEPLAGTAPTASGWLLVEQPGAWGRDALTGSALDPELGRALAQRAEGHEVRVQLVRRPRSVTTTPPGPGRTVVLTHAGPTPWTERLTGVDDAGLAALDPALCAAPRAPGLGDRVEGPVVLVCTHGKRDRCCATLGRPIADTLAALHPDLVWESSHVGGHRFAGNLVLLPEGLVYGALGVADALEVLTAHLAGRVSVAHLRGRSRLDRASQAAEVHVRAALGLDGPDDVEVVEVVTEGQQVTARVHAAGRVVTARLERRPLGTLRRLSCDSEDEQDPDVLRLVSLGPAPPR
jgi:hypothetical protein